MRYLAVVCAMLVSLAVAATATSGARVHGVELGADKKQQVSTS